MKQEKKQPTALGFAYEAVTRDLKCTHQQLVNENVGVNHPTLRRIRNGLTIKPITHAFYMRLFLRILKDEYVRRIEEGGEGATEILRTLAGILLMEHNMNLF